MFVFVETVLRRCRMFQGSDEVQNPLLYHAEQKNSDRLDLFTLGLDLEVFCSFFYYNGVATAEGTAFWTPEANKT